MSDATAGNTTTLLESDVREIIGAVESLRSVLSHQRKKYRDKNLEVVARRTSECLASHGIPPGCRIDEDLSSVETLKANRSKPKAQRTTVRLILQVCNPSIDLISDLRDHVDRIVNAGFEISEQDRSEFLDSTAGADERADQLDDLVFVVVCKPAGKTKRRGGPKPQYEALWEVHQEMKAKNLNVTDQDVIDEYHRRFRKRPTVKVGNLRSLRHRKKKKQDLLESQH